MGLFVPAMFNCCLIITTCDLPTKGYYPTMFVLCTSKRYTLLNALRLVMEATEDIMGPEFVNCDIEASLIRETRGHFPAASTTGEKSKTQGIAWVNEYIRKCIECDKSGRCLVTVMDKVGIYLAFSSETKGKLLTRNSAVPYYRQATLRMRYQFPQYRASLESRLLKTGKTLDIYCLKRHGSGYVSKVPSCTSITLQTFETVRRRKNPPKTARLPLPAASRTRHYRKKQVVIVTPEQQRRANQYLALWIAKTMRPLVIVENEGLAFYVRYITETLGGISLKVPGRTQVRVESCS
ncbi:Hypothetical protein PHPALM_3223 [Phytophthora palmivora]|uniref:MULE transposase domain-containing protein n=1 Tax=Phytophthora palmivora TaxID=4796 RepID=A0A2P4YMZ0_9STRA|nr:Hypothetical protein PHPALM_3223 [Phytophthora palmivora]